MKLGFDYGTTYIEFDVVFKKRKTIKLTVEPPDKVIVMAPLGVAEDLLIEKVKTKANWIVKNIVRFKNIKYQNIAKEFVNGESFMYLGRSYSLQIVLDEAVKKPEVKLYRGKFYVTVVKKDEETIRAAMEEWYRAKGKEQIEDRIMHFQKYFKEKPNSIKVKEQKSRWGSCTYKNDLLFNWRMVMARADVLDYVIVHEMCHMIHKDHSKNFWQSVESIIPDYKDKKEWLKYNGIRMQL